MSAVPYNGYGMPQMGRRNQRRPQMQQQGPMIPQTGQVQQQQAPVAAQPVQQSAQSPVPQVARPPVPSVYQQAALRANMARNVYANTLAANNPATANLPHVRAAIAARSIANEGIAQQAGMGQNYFQGREMTADANTRANDLNTANVGQVYANTDQTNMGTYAQGVMLPYQAQGAALANRGTELANAATQTQNAYLPGQLARKAQTETIQNQYLPGQLQGQQEQQRAVTAKTGADAALTGAETQRMREGNDPKTLQSLQKSNSDLQKQLADAQKQLAELTAKMTGGASAYGQAAQGGQPQQNAAPPQQQGQQQDGVNPDGTRNHNGRRYKLVNGTWVAVQ